MATKEIKTEEGKEKNTDVLKFSLSDGTAVVMKKINAAKVIMARKSATIKEAAITYMLAEMCTFNGEQIPAEEILELPMDDYFMLEEKWGEIVEAKNSRAQEK